MSARIFCLTSSADDLTLLPALADAGVDGFQVRDKALSTGALVALTRSVLDAVRPHGAIVVVNDRLDVALAAGADGVHLGAADLAVADRPPARARAAGRRDLPLARRGRRRRGGRGPTMPASGPVLATSSKAGLPAPLGLAAVTAAAGVLPLVAIGGLGALAAAQARAAGAYGVAGHRRDLATTRSPRCSEGARRGGRLMRIDVLGAGIIGLTVAEELGPARAQRRGGSTRDPAGGASYAAAGMLSPGAEVWHGEEEILRLGLSSLALWAGARRAAGRRAAADRHPPRRVRRRRPAAGRAPGRAARHARPRGPAARPGRRPGGRADPGPGGRRRAAAGRGERGPARRVRRAARPGSRSAAPRAPTPRSP
jgi:thiamine-phosphate pyrophosphorylase